MEEDFQLGVGVPGGCKAVLHSVNRLIESKGNEFRLSMLLADFKNAFNLVDRSVLLQEARSINQSCELTLQDWYFDDSTIVEDTHMVAKALDIISTDGPARGLSLNVDKTELFWPVEDPISRAEGVFPINISCPLNGVKLLDGSVSLDESFCRDLALKRVSKNISLMEAIHKLNDPQCKLLLLCNCVGVAKLSYALRTCSSLYLLEAQVQLDQTLRAFLEKIVVASWLEFGSLCPSCNVHRMDQWGDHAVHCSSEVGVNFRHNLVRILVDICSKVGIMVRKEAPMGFLLKGRKELQPADLLLFNWLEGKYACLDVTGISPFAGTGASSWALGNAIEKKKKKYASKCEDNGYKFIPFAFSTFGEFDTEALDTLSRIKSIVNSHSNNARMMFLSFIE
ncbi:hypothetical protein CTI12_AA187660 [Artemisia annua]|uniref:Reverse transcriptase domain-containing protein n=1 Tax=Artemisia annua TaxID=35608 RepID=A0A2U1P6R0_ARTAN|nr:hypothetical protein CTI12_AA187660 [Artemisia annua]